MRKFKTRPYSYPRVIAAGFFALIALGTVLLMLPLSAQSGRATGLVNALFTAVSATCVTGLVVVDTATYWSPFGQGVLLGLIQVGGLGLVTVLAQMAVFLRRRIGLRERGLLQESVNSLYLGGIVRLTKKVFHGTLILEGAGAVLLALRFVPALGWGRGVWYALFHSVSAFCNAGFDLMGTVTGPYSSLTSFVGDSLVMGTVSALIIVGGIGFFVWDDVTRNGLSLRKYSLHTKLALASTAFFLLVGALLFSVLENGSTLAGLSQQERFWAIFFSSVTPRTAGFNSVDTAALTPASRLLSIALMFVGGSPGSTAGGMKTTTVVVLVMVLWASLRNLKSARIFGRRLEDSAGRRALSVLVIYLLVFLLASMAVCAFNPALPLGDILFETASAINTVGMSTGITRALSPASRVVLSLVMYCGRVGSLSFALLFTEQKNAAALEYPVGRVLIG